MRISCPESTCRADNDVSAAFCVHCQTPLRAYIKLLIHPARLFNQGLDRAYAGEFKQARDLFAAVVYWCPMDLEARNALAAACFTLGDLTDAYQQWEFVSKNSPINTLAHALAMQGLERVRDGQQSQAQLNQKQKLKKQLVTPLPSRNIRKKSCKKRKKR